MTPTNQYGEFLVSGHRNYRGHDPGEKFTARLDRRAEARAIRRGDIRLLRRIIPRPGPHTFPDGWLPAATEADHRGAAEAPLSLNGG